MRKEIRLLLCLVMALMVMSFGTISVMAADADADIEAIVGVALSITNTGDLDFGTFFPGTGGTVVIATDGTLSTTGDVLSLLDDYSAASFDISGVADAEFSITLPANAELTSGANTMTVSNFVSDPDASGTLNAGGTSDLSVGATLTVADSQAAGTYSGTFNVTVNYQ